MGLEGNIKENEEWVVHGILNQQLKEKDMAKKKADKMVVEQHITEYNNETKKFDHSILETIVYATGLGTEKDGSLYIEDKDGVSWIFASGEWARVRRA